MTYNIYFSKTPNFNVSKMITVSNVTEAEARKIAEAMKPVYGMRFVDIMVK